VTFRPRDRAAARATRLLGLAILVAGGLGVAAGVASAHPQTPRIVREMVRLQGTLGEAPSGAPGSREMVLLVFGEHRRLQVTDWRVFATTGEDPRGDPPSEVRLQGDRSELGRLAASSGRRITVLGERRPGSNEIFVLALDVCPPLPDSD
jgi:hypothetical protein